MAQLNAEDAAAYRAQTLYEKEVQEYLAGNLQLLGAPALQLVQLEHPVRFGRDSGRIDILATDALGAFVVIEVKRDLAGRGAIGQLQSYMGAIQADNPGSRVRGILVAIGLDDAARAAISMTQDIDFFEFKTQFRFHRTHEGRQSPGGRMVAAKGDYRKDYWEKLGGVITEETIACKGCGRLALLVKVGPGRLCGLCGAPP